jgi:hypothetical protein
MPKAFLFALLVVVTTRLALAQKGTGTTPASDPTNFLALGSAAARMGSILNFAPSGRRQGSPRFSPSWFLTDPFLSRLPGSSYPPTASSPVITLRGAAESLPPPADQGPQQGPPLLIELRGDQYVQISSNGTESDEHSAQPDYFREMSGSVGAKSGRSPAKVGKTNVLSSRPRVSRGQVNTKNALAAGVLPHELAPTVLVYRDGRREEVREYSIADGVLYARGDYYAVGYWNKKIELVALDVPQTIKANQERGVKFVLPDSPNNVVMNW